MYKNTDLTLPEKDVMNTDDKVAEIEKICQATQDKITKEKLISSRKYHAYYLMYWNISAFLNKEKAKGFCDWPGLVNRLQTVEFFKQSYIYREICNHEFLDKIMKFALEPAVSMDLIFPLKFFQRLKDFRMITNFKKDEETESLNKFVDAILASENEVPLQAQLSFQQQPLHSEELPSSHQYFIENQSQSMHPNPIEENVNQTISYSILSIDAAQFQQEDQISHEQFLAPDLNQDNCSKKHNLSNDQMRPNKRLKLSETDSALNTDENKDTNQQNTSGFTPSTSNHDNSLIDKQPADSESLQQYPPLSKIHAAIWANTSKTAAEASLGVPEKTLDQHLGTFSYKGRALSYKLLLRTSREEMRAFYGEVYDQPCKIYELVPQEKSENYNSLVFYPYSQASSNYSREYEKSLK